MLVQYVVARGDVCWYTFKAPDNKRPVLILTRDSAIAVLHLGCTHHLYDP